MIKNDMAREEIAYNEHGNGNQLVINVVLLIF